MSAHRGSKVFQAPTREQQNTATLQNAEEAAAIAETTARHVADSLGCTGAAVARVVERTFDPRTSTWRTVVLLTYGNGVTLEVDRRTDLVTIRKGVKR